MRSTEKTQKRQRKSALKQARFYADAVRRNFGGQRAVAACVVTESGHFIVEPRAGG